MISVRILYDTSQNENFEYGYPHFNAILRFCLKFERCKLHKAAYHPTKHDVIDDVKIFQTVGLYRRIYCQKIFDVIQSDKSQRIRIHDSSLIISRSGS